MKKIFILFIALVLVLSVFSTISVHTSATQPIEELLNWNGVVFENVNNVIDIEGTIAVGGDFISNTGFSAGSGAYGMDPIITDGTSLLVNGNVNIAGYGNVWGSTVVGNSDGNVYHLSNITKDNTTNGQYLVKDNTEYFTNLKEIAYTVKSNIETLSTNGVCESSWGTYTFIGDSTKDTLVYSVNDSNLSSYLFDFTISENQTVIVNFTTENRIDLKYGGVRINGNTDPNYLRKFNRNIILNVENSIHFFLIRG